MPILKCDHYLSFVLNCSHLFVPLSCRSKVLSFDNSIKKCLFCFELFSLIRTFLLSQEGTFVRQNQIKTSFIWFCAHLFVPLSAK